MAWVLATGEDDAIYHGVTRVVRRERFFGVDVVAGTAYVAVDAVRVGPIGLNRYGHEALLREEPLRDLARAHTLLQHGEDGTGEQLRIDAFVASELLLDAGQELLYMARAHRCACGIPALIVEAADQHGELGSELRHLLHREPVAQRMQSCSQGEIRPVPVRLAQRLRQVL